MEKTFIERRVYNGAEVRRGYRVTGIRCVQDGPNNMPRELAKANNMLEYSSGCGEHRGSCFGHMSKTPTGNILPPHSLSFRSGDIRTQYYIAATKAFEQDPREYVEALKRTNYGKEGHLRSIMSTPVSGSARLVCIPHDYSDPRVFFISKALASKVVFCLPEGSSEGLPGARYKERRLEEGDYVMVERPPSLSIYNNQPLRVQFWDKECSGVHPKVFSFFHGDYDGDEIHVYALGNPESIEEAKKWKVPLDPNLCAAGEYMEKTLPLEYGTDKPEGDLKFIEYTTLSFQQIRDGTEKLPIGDYTRNKEEHLRMFSERMRMKKGTDTFLAEAVKGVKDIMRQQVSQGKIGDMSRVARISAMCFARAPEGGTYVVTRRSRVLLNPFTAGSSGVPSVRCIMILCQASQQAALDAHRVGSKEVKGLDLISSLLKGREESGGLPCSTLVTLNTKLIENLKADAAVSWCAKLEEGCVAIVRDDVDSELIVSNVTGAYSPVVLSSIPAERRKEACREALNLVYNYYKLKSEGDDILDLVEAMCYKVETSVYPVTTRKGILERGLGWMETLMACDYTKLPSLAGSFSSTYSATSATMCSNFSSLR